MNAFWWLFAADVLVGLVDLILLFIGLMRWWGRRCIRRHQL